MLLLIGAIGVFAECTEKENTGRPNGLDAYAGPEKCAACHQGIFERHRRTAHFLSSAKADTANILGSFASGENTFSYNPAVSVKMEKNATGLYQNLYRFDKKTGGKRMDITVGSGTKGHSFLSWVDSNKLVQLPITYFTPANAWGISPGFAMNKPEFNRIVTARCLECHFTYAQKTGEPQPHIEEFDSACIIYAIGCERCHGAGKLHVAYHTAHPDEKVARYIVNPEKLPRDRRVDLCGLCHGGAMEKTGPSFAFVPGDPLSNYFSTAALVANADNIDMHGKQLGLLALSKCFTAGKVLCESCHSVHDNERGKTDLFVARCLVCHSGSGHRTCSDTGLSPEQRKKYCLDCHVPKQVSRAVAVMLQGGAYPTPALLRNHNIKVYSEETGKIKDFIHAENENK